MGRVRFRLQAERGAIPPFPFFRLTMLASGVCAVAAIGTIDNGLWETSCLILAVVLVATTFRLDREAGNKLFPSHALSFRAPIGLCLWTLTLHAMAQTSVTLFLPLLLQVSHGVSPVFVNFVTIVISFSWTVGTVAAVPGGAYPSYAQGYYKRDNAFYKAWDGIAREREGFLAWMQHHVLDSADFADFERRLKVANG